MLLMQDQSVAFMLDTNGRLPLHLALIYHRPNREILAAIIAANNESEETDNYNEDAHEEEGSAATGAGDYIIYSVPLIKALVRANPKALGHAEPSTGLYPFLLAASNDTSSTLDMVFFLLYSNPSVVVNNVLLLRRKIEPSS